MTQVTIRREVPNGTTGRDHLAYAALSHSNTVAFGRAPRITTGHDLHGQ